MSSTRMPDVLLLICVSLFCRRLWQHVTASLKSGNMDAATEHKHRLEERQRKEGKQRAATKTPWKPKYFIKEVSSLHTSDITRITLTLHYI